ncbi:hypothetical protein C8R44DRAFT_866274 [Mycena epipterygia]|nr:hypothetical protein C8R44DRAFT_866274 [Mycena epipterygia]
MNSGSQYLPDCTREKLAEDSNKHEVEIACIGDLEGGCNEPSVVGSGSFDLGNNDDNNINGGTVIQNSGNNGNNNNVIGSNDNIGGNDTLGSGTAGASASLSAGVSAARTGPSSEFTLLVVLVVLVGLLVLLVALVLTVLLLWTRSYRRRNSFPKKLLDVEESVEEVSQPLPAAAETQSSAAGFLRPFSVRRIPVAVEAYQVRVRGKGAE